jgi:hypothetical protein
VEYMAFGTFFKHIIPFARNTFVGSWLSRKYWNFLIMKGLSLWNEIDVNPSFSSGRSDDGGRGRDCGRDRRLSGRGRVRDGRFRDHDRKLSGRGHARDGRGRDGRGCVRGRQLQNIYLTRINRH